MRVIEIKDRIGNFPLMTAVYANNIELIELLISKGFLHLVFVFSSSLRMIPFQMFLKFQ